jgi:4-hydroxy-tetrahydrodipicolinate reductase
MVKLIITGAAGKVGIAIIKCALEDTDFEIVGLVETKTHPDIGKLSATMAGTTDKLLLIEDSLEKVIEKGDAVIDFTEAKASLQDRETARKGPRHRHNRIQR